MKNIHFKKLLPHLFAIIFFMLLSVIYFPKIMEGKKLYQNDNIQWQGMSKEVEDNREKTGEQALWTNSLFGGMPSYLVSMRIENNLTSIFNRMLNLIFLKQIGNVFLLLLGFYIALIIFQVNPWLSVIGAIAYAFSSYFFIVLEAGHVIKVLALGYMPPIIAGVYLAFNNNKIWGSLIFGLFFSLQLIANHVQMTYYMFFIIGIYMVFRFVNSLKANDLKKFLNPFLALFITGILAIGSNAETMLPLYEYSKYSMRGKSELTNNKEDKTEGLDRSYATSWSYGKMETFTLLIPNFKGGSSHGELDKNSETYKVLKSNNVPNTKEIIKQMPLYFGEQPFTSGPVYVGAIICLFFIFGLFVIKGEVKWWLLSATVFSILMAWGKHFMFLTDLFLDYFPMYDKFRAVSSILIIAEFTMPLLAILAIKKVLYGQISKKEFKDALLKSFAILASITLFFAIFSGFFDFNAYGDGRLLANGYPQWLLDAIVKDRENLFRADAFRSFIFILIASAAIWFYMQEKIKKNIFIVILVTLVLLDMWTINKRYLNNDDFVASRNVDIPFNPTTADRQIMSDKDPYFRVLNLSVNTFNDASTSYFHKSVGGYHGAKMKRYQELIEFHISKNNMEVLNMLNTKYFIIGNKKGHEPTAQFNPNALGNVWFVESYKTVKNADEEIQALSDFKAKKEAIIDIRFKDFLNNFEIKKDDDAVINLTKYNLDKLEYEYQIKNSQLAVFSDIYYEKGWNAYVDGKLLPHFRANYVLRAMILPEGKHNLVFKFEPKSHSIGSKVSLVSSSILIILMAFALFKSIKKQNFKL